MAMRTVRLDEEAEATLRQIREATGLPISEALKQGLRSLKQHVRDSSGPPLMLIVRRFWEVRNA
jgi:hypothetical protein